MHRTLVPAAAPVNLEGQSQDQIYNNLFARHPSMPGNSKRLPSVAYPRVPTTWLGTLLLMLLSGQASSDNMAKNESS